MDAYIRLTATLVCPGETLQPGSGTYVQSCIYNSDLYNGNSNSPINIARLNSPSQTVELCEASLDFQMLPP